MNLHVLVFSDRYREYQKSYTVWDIDFNYSTKILWEENRLLEEPGLKPTNMTSKQITGHAIHALAQ